MGFSISEMYEQTGLAFYLCVNLLITIVYVVLLFPSHSYQAFLIFLIRQVITDGKMQSGNISIIFIGLLIITFLLNHLSNWVESFLYPKMDISPIKFDYLIAHRFWNIATLYRKNTSNEFLIDTVNDSFTSIFSIEDPSSDVTRMLGVRQRKWRFYKVFAGTFKLGMYLSSIFALYQLFLKLNFKGVCYYLLVSVGSLLLWFSMDLLLCNVVWSMFDSFWSYQKYSTEAKGTYLDVLFKRDYLTFWSDSFSKITIKQRIHDLTSGRIIRWKWK
ncbi:hypothetical protein EFS21_01680 [Levilactobacillus brevis]|uniref:hypothetical protein n=1 Tax=Levilactobacillus brevis TaxID=1580 RepID=UPI0021A61BE0|nr:hypothetical protein [Levilactobacillus brevis]MCT3589329.1 hypothetical protein [Levilactobacillus brevis]